MWVARNRNNSLYAFYDKPYREQNWRWVIDSKALRIIELKDEDYPQFKDLRWEDEPVEIELVPKMLNAVQEKLAESIEAYFDYTFHVQDIHPYSKEQEQNYYDNMGWRAQDWEAIKYDHPSTWDLNFDDYVGSKR